MSTDYHRMVVFDGRNAPHAHGEDIGPGDEDMVDAAIPGMNRKPEKPVSSEPTKDVNMNNGNAGFYNNVPIEAVPAGMRGNAKEIIYKPTKSDDDPDEMDGKALENTAFLPLTKTNQFQLRKTAAQAMVDVALMMANCSQLRTLINAGEDAPYFHAQVCLVSISLLCQILFALLILTICAKEAAQDAEEEKLKRKVACNQANPTARKAALKELEAVRDQREDKNVSSYTRKLNTMSMVLMLTITIVNIFITGLGIKVECRVELAGNTDALAS